MQSRDGAVQVRLAVMIALGVAACAPAVRAQGPGYPPPGARPFGGPPYGGPPPWGGPPPFGGPGGPRMRAEVALAEVPIDALKGLLKLTDAQTKRAEKVVEKARAERRPPLGLMQPPGQMQLRRGDFRLPPPPPTDGGGPPMLPPPAPDGFGPGAPGGLFMRGMPGGPGGAGGPGGPGAPGGRGGPMRQIAQKASREIEANLTDAQRRQLPGVLKAMRTLRNARIPLSLVPKLKLTTGQVAKLAALPSGSDDARLDAILTRAQRDAVEPYRQPGPAGRFDGPPGGAPEPGFGGPGGPWPPDGPDGPEGGQRR